MLIFPIKKKWFDKILSGEKTEEYREIKLYYTTRFTTIDLLDTSGRPTNNKVWIIFRNGYSSQSPSFEALCQLSIGFGRTDWGAESSTVYYKLKILKIKR